MDDSKKELLRTLLSAVASGDADMQVVKVDKDEDNEAPSGKMPADRAMQARVLKDILPELQRPNPFKVGDLVVQRKAHKSYQYPRDRDLAIVSHVVDDPLAGTPRASRPDRVTNEREDIVILCFAKSQWVEFAVESWRFDLYDGPVE